MKKKKVMALLLSTTLTVANITPALAADTSNVAVTSEVTQDAPADDATVVEENTEAAPDVTENEETPADEGKNASEDTETPTDESANGQEESYTEETDNTVAQAADQEEQGAVQAEDGESLPINNEFTENYLVYKVVGDKQVDVVDHDMWDKTGDVVVNPTVEHDNVTYQVATVRKESFWEDRSVKTITFKMGVKNIESVFMGGAKYVSNVVIEDPEANMVVKDGCVYSSDMTRLEAMIPKYPMESYTTPDSVTTIAGRAIQSNTCKVVTLSDNVTTLEDSATGYMPGTEVFNMGSGVTEVENGQFYNCKNLKELNIKGSFFAAWDFVTNCPELETVTLDGNITGSSFGFFTECPKIKSFDVIHSTYERSVNGVLLNGNTIMRYPAGKEGDSYYIPSGAEVDGQAFNSCQYLKTLYVGSNVALSAGMVYGPAQAMDVYLLDTNKITIGARSSYLFCDMPKGSHIYCASEDRITELNAYDMVAISDDGNLPEITVKRVPYTSASFGMDRTVELFEGEKEQHTVSKLAPVYGNDDLVYRSSDEDVCTVAADGTITAMKAGDAEITVSNASDGKVLDSYTVQVKKTTVHTIAFEQNDVDMTVKGGAKKLHLVFDPADAETTEGITWSSDHTDIATVQDGVVTPHKAGDAVITAKIQGKTASCTIHVTNPLEGISLEATKLEMEKGETKTLKLLTDPADPTDRIDASWKSSNWRVVDVFNGKLRAKKSGTATITVTVGNFTATCEVTVIVPVESITLPEAVDLERGEKEQLSVKLLPEDTTITADQLTWTSADPKIVSVDPNGELTGVGYGTTTVTVSYGDITAETTVTVSHAGLDKAEVTLSQEYFDFDGTEKCPDLTVKLEGKTLKEGVDYEVEYSDNIHAGEASYTLHPLGDRKKTKTGTFTILRATLSRAEVSGVMDKKYDGSAQTQDDITVKVLGRTLKKGVDYTVSYWNNVNSGTASMTITGIGDYSGVITSTFQIQATGQWIGGSRWWYRHSDGSYTKNGWEVINGKWYFFNSAGWMVTGWLSRPSGWYYLTPSGAMATGWTAVNGHWYYLDPADGHMHVGWYQVNGVWYYSNASGAMQTGWLHTASGWYYLSGSGAMLTGWAAIGGHWYYLNPSDGHMATGWAKVNGKWYYMNGSGAMLTGWLHHGNNWYYLDASGAMAENTWVGNYYVDGSGAWVKTR